MTKQRILLIVSAIIAALVLLIFIITLTFNVWFFVNVVIWGYLIYRLYTLSPDKSYDMKKIIGSIVLLTIFSLVSLISIGSKNTSKKAVVISPEVKIEYKTIMDPIALVDLSLDLENSLKLEDVMTSEVEGGIIEIRTRAPENVSADAIMAATSYVFGYVDPKLSDQIRTIRLIFTVNGLDASLIEVSRANVKSWIAKTITDQAFVSSMKRTNLIK